MAMHFFTLICLLFSLSSFAQIEYPYANGTLVVPELGSRSSLDCVGCQRPLSFFIRNRFNRPGDFFGPNCYNTALIAAGLMKEKQIRYVSPEEFEVLLSRHFTPLAGPTPMSVVVFDANSSRGHAGYYLGDNLVFHKKSFNTNYHYRITTQELVGVVEKNEWVPSPIEGSINQFVWPQLGHLPKSYYRIRNKQIRYQQEFAPQLYMLENLLLVDLGQWAIAKKWGLVGLQLLEDYLKLVDGKADPLTKGTLISFKDQISVFIEEVYYKNSRSYDRTTQEICLPENPEQLKAIYQRLASSLNLPANRWEQVATQDLKKCRVRLLKSF